MSYPPDEPVSERRSRWTPPLVEQLLKEVVSAVIGLTLVAFTVYFAVRAADLAGKGAVQKDTKDVLQVMVGLAGVVLGYYFGRIPADARAAQAQELMAKETARATMVWAKGNELAEHVDRAFVSGEPTEPDKERMRELWGQLRTLTQSG
jgi:NhaP-type Na+/H+ or K+/H+ antiporter